MDAKSSFLKCICIIPHRNTSSLLEFERKTFCNYDFSVRFPLVIPLQFFYQNAVLTDAFDAWYDVLHSAHALELEEIHLEKNKLYRNFDVTTGNVASSEDNFILANSEEFECAKNLRQNAIYYGKLDSNKVALLDSKPIHLRVFRLVELSLFFTQSTSQNTQVVWSVEREKWVKKSQ